jgi:hypothetical protein
MIYFTMISYYLMAGLLVALTVEFCVNRIERFLIESGEEDEILPWGNLERIVTITVWPYTIVIFVIAIFKFINDKK